MIPRGYLHAIQDWSNKNGLDNSIKYKKTDNNYPTNLWNNYLGDWEKHDIKFEIGVCRGNHTILLSIKDQKLYGFGSNIIINAKCGYDYTMIVCECFDS